MAGNESTNKGLQKNHEETIIKLPSFKTIETAITANKATVVEHLMKKRETKEWQKHEQRGMKDKINQSRIEAAVDIVIP